LLSARKLHAQIGAAKENIRQAIERQKEYNDRQTLRPGKAIPRRRVRRENLFSSGSLSGAGDTMPAVGYPKAAC
jgi:hypothetical protein